jgi:hypothetical protein
MACDDGLPNYPNAKLENPRAPRRFAPSHQVRWSKTVSSRGFPYPISISLLLSLTSLLLEEPRQEFATLTGEHAPSHLGSVIEPPIL